MDTTIEQVERNAKNMKRDEFAKFAAKFGITWQGGPRAAVVDELKRRIDANKDTGEHQGPADSSEYAAKKTANKGKRAGAKSAAKSDAPATKKSGRGRKSLRESMTAEEIAAEIKELLNDLAAASSVDEKKRIRRALRLRGHAGGLQKGNGGAGVTASKK